MICKNATFESISYNEQNSFLDVDARKVTAEEGLFNNITTEAICVTSDIRRKKDIKSINLIDFNKLNPVEFKYRISGKKSFGFIAQDLEKIYPELVVESQGYKRVDYIGIIGILCAKIQEF